MLEQMQNIESRIESSRDNRRLRRRPDPADAVEWLAHLIAQDAAIPGAEARVTIIAREPWQGVLYSGLKLSLVLTLYGRQAMPGARRFARRIDSFEGDPPGHWLVGLTAQPAEPGMIDLGIPAEAGPGREVRKIALEAVILRAC